LSGLDTLFNSGESAIGEMLIELSGGLRRYFE